MALAGKHVECPDCGTRGYLHVIKRARISKEDRGYGLRRYRYECYSCHKITDTDDELVATPHQWQADLSTRLDDEDNGIRTAIVVTKGNGGTSIDIVTDKGEYLGQLNLSVMFNDKDEARQMIVDTIPRGKNTLNANAIVFGNKMAFTDRTLMREGVSIISADIAFKDDA